MIAAVTTAIARQVNAESTVMTGCPLISNAKLNASMDRTCTITSTTSDIQWMMRVFMVDSVVVGSGVDVLHLQGNKNCVISYDRRCGLDRIAVGRMLRCAVFLQCLRCEGICVA